MGKPTGFMEFERQLPQDRDPKERLGDWKEFHGKLAEQELRNQGARCMDCGVPFCHAGIMLNGGAAGCPIHNLIPEWNDLVYSDRWREAFDRLQETNNFPEFTGRVCPAPCEGSCVLSIHEPPVAIKQNEVNIIERAFENGWVTNNAPSFRSGKKVAVVGSGPAGLAAAVQLNKAGHLVTIYERSDRAGGLLMYGIPGMKMEKSIVQRRIDMMEGAGVQFVLNTEVGRDISAEKLQEEFDAVVLCGGATLPRDLPVPGRDLEGVHFAMDFLHKNTKSLLDSDLEDGQYIDTKGKKVIVIGGGDTGTDCVGTSLRHGCADVRQLEIMSRAPESRTENNPWPEWPRVYSMDYGQEEAAAVQGEDPRIYDTMTKSFEGRNGKLTAVKTVQVKWKKGANGRLSPIEVPGSENTLEADIVLLAMGFLGPDNTLLKSFAVGQDQRTNISTKNYRTTEDGIYAAGDIRRGQSLVVWAIQEGRGVARIVDEDLMGSTRLPE